MRQPGQGEEDNAMLDHDEVPDEDEMPRNDETLRSLESLRELAKRNMPNTITFIPHRMRKRLARMYNSKLNELLSHMRMGMDTMKREMLNLLVWAIPLSYRVFR